MATIYLIRHAQSVGNIEKRLAGRKDYTLTDEGYNQVNKLTDRLKNIHFDVAYSSPKIRAVETIKPLAEINYLSINIDDKLSEMDFGIYDGFKWDEVNEIDPSISNRRKEINEIAGIPKQETMQEVKNRMYNKILKIANENKGKTILIASHGVAIEAFLKQVTGETFLQNKDKNSQKNTSINIIQYDEKYNKFEIKLLNDFTHLQ